MSIQQDNLKAIADKIRELTGTSDKLVPSSFVDKVQNACDIKEAKGRTEGHETGYTEGHTAGHTEGYNSGKTDGLSEGYDTGHAEGKEEAYAERPRFATGTVELNSVSEFSLNFGFSPVGLLMFRKFGYGKSLSIISTLTYDKTTKEDSATIESQSETEIAYKRANVALISRGMVITSATPIETDSGDVLPVFNGTYAYFAYE